jgi:hypothetical protein
MDILVTFLVVSGTSVLLAVISRPLKEGPFSRNWWIPRWKVAVGMMYGGGSGWILSTLLHKAPIGTWDLAIPIALMVTAHVVGRLARIPEDVRLFNESPTKA